MNDFDIEYNAQHLFFHPAYTCFARDGKYQEIKPFCFPLLGRLIFKIVDFFRKGAESKKVHDLAIETFVAMEQQMNTDGTRWHFNGDERFGYYRGCPVEGKTYKSLALHLMNKQHPLSKYQDIQDKAQSIITQFDQLPIFHRYSQLTQKQIINQGIGNENPPSTPSVTEDKIKMLIKHLGKYPDDDAVVIS